MKKAVIFVGLRGHGKSYIINKKLKPLLGMGEYENTFQMNGKSGFITSHTLNKSDNSIHSLLSIQNAHDLLVLTAMHDDNNAIISEASRSLAKLGYSVNLLYIFRDDSVCDEASRKSFLQAQANAAFNILRS